LLLVQARLQLLLVALTLAERYALCDLSRSCPNSRVESIDHRLVDSIWIDRDRVEGCEHQTQFRT
jgi:hypothetical protein